MREVDVNRITEAVAELCIEANRKLPDDVIEALKELRAGEPWQPAQAVLEKMLGNADVAAQRELPICQDTGAANVYVQVGQDVHLVGGALEEAIHEGVRRGYGEGYLRKSIVADPIRRGNTGDNTPAFITTQIVPGDRVHVVVAPKGFGSENMSRLAMLNPADGREGVEAFVLEAVRLAGPNPCPPIVVGVGIGGSFDKVAYLAKKALLRPLDVANHDPYYAEMERDLLERINALGIGPAGYGGRGTALAVAIETMPTHIAGLPVAVNLNCHVSRRASATL